MAVHDRYRPPDLSGAIRAAEQAVDDGASDPRRGMYLTSLASARLAHAERTGDTADLDRAVETYQEAADATPTDHSDRAGRMSNLAVALRTRARRTASRMTSRCNPSQTASPINPTSSTMSRSTLWAWVEA